MNEDPDEKQKPSGTVVTIDADIIPIVDSYRKGGLKNRRLVIRHLVLIADNELKKHTR